MLGAMTDLMQCGACHHLCFRFHVILSFSTLKTHVRHKASRLVGPSAHTANANPYRLSASHQLPHGTCLSANTGPHCLVPPCFMRLVCAQETQFSVVDHAPCAPSGFRQLGFDPPCPCGLGAVHRHRSHRPPGSPSNATTWGVTGIASAEFGTTIWGY